MDKDTGSRSKEDTIDDIDTIIPTNDSYEQEDIDEIRRLTVKMVKFNEKIRSLDKKRDELVGSRSVIAKKISRLLRHKMEIVRVEYKREGGEKKDYMFKLMESRGSGRFFPVEVRLHGEGERKDMKNRGKIVKGHGKSRQ